MNYLIERLAIDTLSPKKIRSYALFTTPEFRSCLRGIDPDNFSHIRIIVIGVSLGGQPVGLSIARVTPSSQLGEIFSLFIAPCHRHRGLGNRLFQKMEEVCFLEGSKLLIFKYQKSGRSLPCFENIFIKNGWKGPKLFMIRSFYDSYTFKPPWLLTPPQLSSEYREFPWGDLQEEEKRNLLYRFAQKRYHPSIFPFCGPDQDNIESINSLGLRHNEEIIAWVITHRLSHDTLRYSMLYCEPEYQRTGYPIRLLVDSIKLQQQSSVRWALFEINVEEVDKSWMHFVNYRLIPYALTVRETSIIWKPALS